MLWTGLNEEYAGDRVKWNFRTRMGDKAKEKKTLHRGDTVCQKLYNLIGHKEIDNNIIQFCPWTYNNRSMILSFEFLRIVSP